MLSSFLDFVLSALPNWMAVSLMLLDRYERWKVKRADDVEESESKK